MAIYTPYFYIIQEVSTGMYYAGAKWAEGCHPDELLRANGYKTSSATIKHLINQNGVESFVIRKIKTFSVPYDSFIYETKFLRRVDAKSNPMFYNCHNNDGGYDIEQARKNTKLMFGVDYPFQCKTIQEKCKVTVASRYGVTNISQVEEVKKKKLKSRKITESLMTEKELALYRKSTNEKISKAHLSMTDSERAEALEKFRDTLQKTPDSVKRDRVERAKQSKQLIRESTIEKQKKTLKERPPKTCPHCGLETNNYSNYTRWHGDKCKKK